MTHVFDKVIKVPLHKWLFFALLVLAIVTGIIYFKVDDSSLWAPLLASSVAGLLMLVIQFLMSWQDYAASARLKALGIKDIRADRDKRGFYDLLIKDAIERIDVLGVTGSRFMEHFADINSNREDALSLIYALNRGVKVRILVPTKVHLDSPDEKLNYDRAKMKFQEVKKRNPNFEYRYFDHLPTHSIVRIDKECILGPVFPMLASKDAPCIHMQIINPFAQKYVDYFENEWEQADDSD